MRKIRLDLYALDVASFSTAPVATGGGTVRGRESLWTCLQTCFVDCQTDAQCVGYLTQENCGTQEKSCETGYATCAVTCNDTCTCPYSYHLGSCTCMD